MLFSIFTFNPATKIQTLNALYVSAPTNLVVVHTGSSSVKDVSSSISLNIGTETNDYTYTHTQDNGCHQITEVRTVGSPHDPKPGGAEVVYNVPITGSSAPYTLNIDAYRIDSGNENFNVS